MSSEIAALVADLKVIASDADRLAKALARHADTADVAAADTAEHQQHKIIRELHGMLHRAEHAVAEVGRSIERGLADMPAELSSARR